MNHWSSSSPKSSISVPFLATSNAPRTAHRAVRALRATRGTSLHQDRPKGSPRFCSLRYSDDESDSLVSPGGRKVGRWDGRARPTEWGTCFGQEVLSESCPNVMAG